MSGGERGRVNLALTLRQGGNLLLLDEPANDLDVETLASLEDALLEFPGCAVITSHDRWFLDRVATHILAWEGDGELVLVRGQLRGLRAEQDRPARRGGGAAAPGHLPQAHPLTRRERHGRRRCSRGDLRAERIVYAAWRIWEEMALERLAGTRGMAHTPLEPRSDVIQLVAYDGQHLGHVRRDAQRPPGECWVAVAVREARSCGRYRTAEAAARGLARACEKQKGESSGQ